MVDLEINPLKYFGGIPVFSGDYRDLENFINLIDRIHPLLATYNDISQKICFDVIKSRITGRAREIIEINNHLSSWTDIKTTLINNFGDRSSLEDLFDQLRGVTFKTNANDFYSDIKSMLRRLNVKTKLALEPAEANKAVGINKTSALTTFKHKLPEPMRSLLYCRNPDSLEKAMDILFESGYAYFTPSPNKNTFVNNNNFNRNNKSYKPHDNSNNNFNKHPHNRNNFNGPQNGQNNNSNKNYRPQNGNNNSSNKFYKPHNNYNNNNQSYRNYNGYNSNNYKPPHNTENSSGNFNPYRNQPDSTFKNPYRGNQNTNNQPQNTPEPMECNIVNVKQPENFPILASTPTFHI